MPSDARDLAALVVSKVYYYLGEYEEALSFALSAGQAFNAQTRSPNVEEYVETVVCKCTAAHASRYFVTRRRSNYGRTTVIPVSLRDEYPLDVFCIAFSFWCELNP